MEEKTFYSHTVVIVKEIIEGALAGAAAAFLLNIFLRKTVLCIAIGVVIFLLFAYSAAIGNRIHIVLTPEKLCVWKGKKCKDEFLRDACTFSAKIRTSQGDSSCDLNVHFPDGTNKHVECSMLGRTRFMELVDALGLNEPVKLN